MIEYPKIETLFNRDKDTFKVITDEIRCPEFSAIKWWHVTEKVDGTNIRVGLENGKRVVNGRTDNAQIPATLYAVLETLLPEEKIKAALPECENLVLFGEGYGPKIQSGGNYSTEQSFCLFDVWVNGIWLEQENVQDVAGKLGVKFAPVVSGGCDLQDAIELAKMKHSYLAMTHDKSGPTEGIVARSKPLLLDRRGNRVMWKLKVKDF